MNLEDVIAETVSREKLLENCSGAVLAVSGGSDSMTMLNWFVRFGPVPFAVGHVNHGMRNEADGEAAALRAYCEEKGVEFYSRKIDIPATCPKGVSEETHARSMRYEYLDTLRRTLGYSHIFTAHNADDNTETFLLNLIRGMGPNGACGIQPLRDDLVARPLINISKADIVAYCDANKIPYFTDKTNFEPICRRNVLRNEIIPLIKRINPSFDDAVARFIKLNGREHSAYMRLCDGLYEKSVIKDADKTLCFGLELFDGDNRFMLSDCLRGFYYEFSGVTLSEEQTALFEKLCYSENGSRLSLPNNIYAEKQYNRIKLYSEDETVLIAETELKKGTVHIEGINGILTVTETENGADLPEDIFCNLTVRSFRAGDKIKIHPKAGTKSISKMFSDAKIPKTERGKIPVICLHGVPVYVCGFGTAVGFKPKGRGIKIEFTPMS